MAEQVNQASEAPRLLRIRQVIERTGMSRAAIYQKIQEGAFPKQVPLSVRAVGFVESEVNRWISQRIAQRNAG